MASSHTGHLAGSDAVVNGLFDQYGVVRVRDLDELLETAALFAKLPAGTGPNACLYSISGGSGALMAEVAESHGVPVPTLSEATREALRTMIPDYLTVSNPVDNGAQFLVTNPIEDRRRVFDLICADENVDFVVVGLTGALGRLTDRFAADIAEFIDELPKPVVVTWNSFKTDEAGFRTLVDAGVPLFRSFRNCFAALNAFAGYERAALHFRPRRAVRARLDPALRSQIDEAVIDEAVIDEAVIDETAAGSSNGRTVLGTALASRLLESFGIPLAGDALTTSAAAAVRAADLFGYPVVMKVASPDVAHKSDAGLVRLDVSSPREVREVYRELTDHARRPGSDATGRRHPGTAAADRRRRDDRRALVRPGVRAGSARRHRWCLRGSIARRSGSPTSRGPTRCGGDGGVTSRSRLARRRPGTPTCRHESARGHRVGGREAGNRVRRPTG